MGITFDAWSAEAQAMAACNHDNLVRIKHAEVTRDGPVLVMEYLSDGSWEGRYMGSPAPVRAVVDAGLDLCWGLHHLHGRNLVHRDIKPGNILLRGDTAVLGDFGLSGLHGTSPSHQYVAHAPPEARAYPVSWTVQADVYALGVTLYRMVCGDDFAGYTALNVGDAAAVAKWPDLTHWPDHVHSTLKRTLRAAMNLDSTKRPQTAAEFRAALQRSRPTVSFREAAPGVWDGYGPKERWRIEVSPLGGGQATLMTRRDKGNGLRSVRHGCVEEPLPETAIRARARTIMNSLATSGRLQT